METVVDLDPDVEELLRQEARKRNVEFNRALNDVVRAAFALSDNDKTQAQPFAQKTYSMGSPRIDLKNALSLAGELENEEVIRKLGLAVDR
ncbi:MAG TPA: hypothetical protein VFB14_12910 [Bryobacteraceae bacterium]|jgi:uncharacterized protein (DUF2236 family)|nr:hypothetical protein [Bryobacteraceae bacterium]